MVIHYGDLLQKKKGEALKVSFKARKSGTNLALSAFDLSVPFARMGVSGQIQNPFDPTVNLKLTMRISSLDQAKHWLSPLKNLPVSGAVDARLDISGKRNPKASWPNWPLRISGQASVSLPQFVMASKPSASAAGSAKTAPAGSASPRQSGFLPEGYLTKNLHLRLQANVGKAIVSGFTTGKVHFQGVLSSGMLTGTLDADQVFSGHMTVKNLNLPLFPVWPKISAQAILNGVEVSRAVAFVSPPVPVQWKDLASGPLSGSVNVRTDLPQDPKFLSELSAAGSVEVKPLHLRMKPVSDMINEKLMKIPKIKPIHRDDINGNAIGDFSLANEVLHLQRFQANDVKGSQLNLSGTVNLKQEMNLKGDLRLAQVPFEGCLKEANQDKQGRFEVPLSLKGSVTSPSWSMATDLVTKLGEKALKCEANKFLKGKQNELQDKLKKGLQDGLKKGLQDLFGH
jgi:hypothetical protein